MPLLYIIASFFLLALAFFLGLVSLIYFSLKKRENYEDLYVPDYLEKIPPPTSFQILGPSPHIPIDGIHWQNLMAKLGKRLESNQIKFIVLIHGTFMGDDPVDIFRLIPLIPNFLKDFIKYVLRTYRKAIFGDQAYFSDEYASLLEKSLKGPKVINFKWNSSNHHCGRLIGALELMKQISAQNQNRVLLIGHSHAGNCLALVTQILENKIPREILKEIIDIVELDEIVNKLRDVKMEMVTLGMPPRYHFQLSSKIKLLNIINHRRNDHLAGHLSGFFRTRDGDYIQQFGIEGSDGVSPVIKEYKINKSLNTILGPGVDLNLMKDNLKKRKRIPFEGMTYLIDYGDHGNFLKTVLGHGIYTDRSQMLKNMKFIIDYFY